MKTKKVPTAIADENKNNTLAHLQLNSCAKWTDEQTGRIAEWLVDQAEMLLTERQNYGDSYDARFIVKNRR